MRQGQQNRRGRGRGGNNSNNNNNNNRNKNQNPLSRSFESNGPDVKIRGTPAHVAEKYITLARDAQSSGDPVLAENYFQHAEHYNRIIMTYREQQVQQNPPQTQQPLPGGEAGESRTDDGPAPASSSEQPDNRDAGGADTPAPQPRGRQPRERSSNVRPRRSRTSANPNRENAIDADAPSAEPRGRRREPENFGAEGDQPEFLRRPVRRPRRASADPGDGDQPKVDVSKVDDASAE